MIYLLKQRVEGDTFPIDMLRSSIVRTFAFALVFSLAAPVLADRIQDESLEDLRRVQKTVQSKLEKSMAATVAIVAPKGMGTGVVIDEDGLILTAGHVSMAPGQRVDIIFNDGRKAKAITLGRHQLSDAGMMRITKPADEKWDYVEVEDEEEISESGEWCYALGHPGGRDEARGMVLRVGRVLEKRRYKVKSSCELMGGDSGGPLFGLNGKVIGIHSFIGGKFTDNYHVSMAPFLAHWDAMVDSDVITTSGRGRGGFLGVGSSNHPDGVVIKQLVKGAAAAKAGLEIGDIISAIDGTPIASYLVFNDHLKQKAPGENIDLNIIRDDELIEMTIELGERP